MTSFRDREQAFEAAYAHDEEFRYLVIGRRDKLFAHWAAARAGLTGDDEATLVAGLLHIPDGTRHDDAIKDRAEEMLAIHRVGATTQELTEALEACTRQAREERLTQPIDHPDQG